MDCILHVFYCCDSLLILPLDVTTFTQLIHTTTKQKPEVGGLVCRMPLEAEIYRGNSSSRMHKKLQQLLESDEYDRLEDVPSTSLKSSPSTGGASTSSLKAQSTASDDPEEEVSFSALAAKTVFWYRGAEKLLKRELGRITMGANENGKIEVDRLGGDSLELLQLYMDHQVSFCCTFSLPQGFIAYPINVKTNLVPLPR